MGKHHVTGTVLVECSDPVEDNQWLLDMSDTDEFIVGVVGHLEPGPTFHTNVSRFARHPRFVGVRPTPPRKSAHCSVEELRHLRDSGLVLDQMAGSSEQMNQFIKDLREVPGLRVVVNHLGHPHTGDGGEIT
jgi:L-fuconolactonase